MSVDDDDSSWYLHYCQKPLQHCLAISTRLQAKRLFYILLLFAAITTLCLSSIPGLLSYPAMHYDVARHESTVILVDASVRDVELSSRDRVNNVKVAIQRPESSPSTAIGLSPPRLSLRSTTPELMPPDLLLSTTESSSLSSSFKTDNWSSPRLRRPTPALSVLQVTRPTNSVSVDNFVSFYGGFADGRGLGNQMFDLAVVIYVAELTGRRPGILKFAYQLALDEVFHLGIERFDDLCPCYVFSESGSLRYDNRVEELAGNGSRADEVRGMSIFMNGFFQSWKYTSSIERRLRQHFVFLPEIRQFVDDFMAASRPPGWLANFVRVGVHVRRGDMLTDEKINFGYTTPGSRYFAHAMRYFVDRFDRIQFIVVSSDIDWCRDNLAEFAMTLRHRVNITYFPPHSRAEDFAVLASCEHVIMSTGTYGWWAGWLVRGTTIYYAGWPRNGSTLDSKFTREDYFPPTWIGMT